MSGLRTYAWPWDLVYDWQTLIGAVLAIIAAILSVHFLRKQIHLAKQQEEDRQRRRSNAARATLPLLLSQIVSYVQRNAELLHAAREKTDIGQLLEDKITFPSEVPERLVGGLERMIEATDQPRLIAYLAEIIGKIQVLNANLEAFNEGDEYHIVTRSNYDAWLIYCAQIYALTSCLFKYARRETEFIDAVTPEEMATAFRVVRADDKGLASSVSWAKDIK